ncbi:hypothetical protein AMECASPLE_031836 [Ameca splendens]|uniref:Uncharacterized protein n=1 Tax=Ameca splendens TaxID=208324 RepID=A0ABV0Y6M3_9TELE
MSKTQKGKVFSHVLFHSCQLHYFPLVSLQNKTLMCRKHMSVFLKENANHKNWISEQWNFDEVVFHYQSVCVFVLLFLLLSEDRFSYFTSKVKTVCSKVRTFPWSSLCFLLGVRVWD